MKAVIKFISSLSHNFNKRCLTGGGVCVCFVSVCVCVKILLHKDYGSPAVWKRSSHL